MWWVPPMSRAVWKVSKASGVAEQETQIFKQYWFFLFPLPNRDSLISVINLRSILTRMTRFNLIELSRQYRSIGLRKTGFSEGNRKMCFVIDFSIPRIVWLKENRRRNEMWVGRGGWADFKSQLVASLELYRSGIPLICCSTISYREIMRQSRSFLISIATAALEPALSTITLHSKTFCLLWREI